MVRRTRFDPLHQAATEQQLYLRLPDWLAALASQESVDVAIETGDGAFSATRAPRAVHAGGGGLVRAARGTGACRPPRGRGRDACAVLARGRAAGARRAPRVAARTRARDAAGHGRGGGAAERAAELAPAEPPALVTALSRRHAASAPVRKRGALAMPTHVIQDGKAHAIDERPLVIGQGAGGGRRIALAGPGSGISHVHCTLQRRDGAVVVRDHSRYGTFVNGERAEGETVLGGGRPPARRLAGRGARTRDGRLKPCHGTPPDPDLQHVLPGRDLLRLRRGRAVLHDHQRAGGAVPHQGKLRTDGGGEEARAGSARRLQAPGGTAERARVDRGQDGPRRGPVARDAREAQADGGGALALRVRHAGAAREPRAPEGRPQVARGEHAPAEGGGAAGERRQQGPRAGRAAAGHAARRRQARAGAGRRLGEHARRDAGQHHPPAQHAAGAAHRLEQVAAGGQHGRLGRLAPARHRAVPDLRVRHRAAPAGGRQRRPLAQHPGCRPDRAGAAGAAPDRADRRHQPRQRICGDQDAVARAGQRHPGHRWPADPGRQAAAGAHARDDGAARGPDAGRRALAAAGRRRRSASCCCRWRAIRRRRSSSGASRGPRAAAS